MTLVVAGGGEQQVRRVGGRKDVMVSYTDLRGTLMGVFQMRDGRSLIS